MLLFFIIPFVLSQLVTWSPNSLSNQQFLYSVSNFGNTTLFQIYSKIKIVTPQNCGFINSFAGDFVLVPSVGECTFEGLAVAAQDQGAMMIIFSLSTLYDIYSVDKDQAAKVSIICIGITQADYLTISQYSDSTIWASFVYPVIEENLETIAFGLSGNYSLDYQFFKKIDDILSVTYSLHGLLEMAVTYMYADDPSVTNVTNDCLQDSNGNVYCMQTQSNVAGSQKLNNSIMIYQYFASKQPTNTFFSTLMEFYQNCEYDYSFNCLNKYITGAASRKNTSVEMLGYNHYAPLYQLNQLWFFWPEFLTEAVLLSDAAVSLNVSTCAPGCTENLLSNSICDSVCNTSDCGYDNLNCFYTGNCLNFLIGDGVCDSWCSDDPDCTGGGGSDVNLAAIIVPVVVGFLLIVIIIIIVICLVLKRRLNSQRQHEIAIPKVLIPASDDYKPSTTTLFPMSFNKNLQFIGDPVCTVDILGFKEEEPVILTPCLHLFHPSCIKEWISSEKREKRCPNCNYALDGVNISVYPA